MARRRWTGSEVERLRELYPSRTAREVGVELGRTTRAVYQEAKKLGLATQPRARVDAAFLAAIRRFNGEGWPDTDIAGYLGCERHTVSGHRKRMGLPSREKGERARERVRYGVALQCRREGVDSLGALWSLSLRRRAAAAGWPADLRPRHVDILEALLARGPMTRREIADAVGMPWKGSRSSLRSNDPEGTYLAHLVGRGLVADLGKIARGNGKGASCRVYAPALGTERGAAWRR